MLTEGFSGFYFRSSQAPGLDLNLPVKLAQGARLSPLETWDVTGGLQI